MEQVQVLMADQLAALQGKFEFRDVNGVLCPPNSMVLPHLSTSPAFCPSNTPNVIFLQPSPSASAPASASSAFPAPAPAPSVFSTPSVFVSPSPFGAAGRGSTPSSTATFPLSPGLFDRR
eukprot:TRINITY_DN10003_c0_g1_i2.p3 TRINITY_DN10003_c0_g1~~TRINITY_DN10003_c0_g1_i2.p3  ORF type:complete len:120 (+),score=19.77 TRINITY_DN10003_c0_g1_i2:432-791(+)